jgi:Ethanolamine utilization protein EutJ (predicted chaperonin)
MDAIRAFAGMDVEKAVVEPGAVAALMEFDSRVRHYDVVEET